MARNAKGADRGSGRPSQLTKPSVAAITTGHGWRAQLLAARYALPLEVAATVAALALGGAHG